MGKVIENPGRGWRRFWHSAGCVVLGLLIAVPGHPADNRIFPAGSLRQALNDIISAYEQGGGQRYVPTYGPSGKLRQEIEQGNVAAVHGIGVTNNAPREGNAFVAFVTGPEGRRIFDRYGFK